MSDQGTRWRLQVQWQEVRLEEFDTFEDAHGRAVDLVREHPAASGVVYGIQGPVSVSASYYRAASTYDQESSTL